MLKYLFWREIAEVPILERKCRTSYSGGKLQMFLMWRENAEVPNREGI